MYLLFLERIVQFACMLSFYIQTSMAAVNESVANLLLALLFSNRNLDLRFNHCSLTNRLDRLYKEKYIMKLTQFVN